MEESFYVPICSHCREPAQRYQVRKDSSNHGRFFFKCEYHCGLFIWEDEVDPKPIASRFQPGTPPPSARMRMLGAQIQALQQFTCAMHPGVVFQCAASPVILKPRIIEEDDELFGIESRYDEDLVMYIKTLQPSAVRKWKPELNMWVYPRDNFQQVMDHLSAGQYIISGRCRREVERELAPLPEPGAAAVGSSAPAAPNQRRRTRAQRDAEDDTARVLFREMEGAVEESRVSRAQVKVEAAAGSLQSRKSEESDDNRLCVICLDQPRTHVLVPCGHARYCEDCSIKVVGRGGSCPECRIKVEKAIKLYT